jgi:hypothetical protein
MTRRIILRSAAAVMASSLWVAAAPAQPSAGQVFTCINAAGRVLTSDRLIGECMDREQKVLARDGSLIRVVPPSLTADERAEHEAREQRETLLRQARAEAVRRDQLLLKRFPSEAEHNKARLSALEDMQTAIRASEYRMADLVRERKPLLDEAEFYKGKTMPSILKQSLDANEAATAAQRDVQVTQKAEMERIIKTFDAELAHLRRLWAGAAPGSLLSQANPEPDKAAKPVKPTPTQRR